MQAMECEERTVAPAVLRGSRPTSSGRTPEEQAEIDRRVAVYARQVEETGRITWLPRRGEGESECPPPRKRMIDRRRAAREGKRFSAFYRGCKDRRAGRMVNPFAPRSEEAECWQAGQKYAEGER